jgi:predicted signal transduction protein with EAL and GGDEF domain
VQFRTGDLVAAVRSALTASGLNAGRLEIEITESTLMQRDSATVQQLHDLNALGVKLVLDDFGTGYSSLSYLHTFPIHCIKIDRSFVASLGENESAVPIVRAIVALASSLGMRTVAEGVETEQQLNELARLGCTEAQGFYFSRPGTAEHMLRAPATRMAQAVPAHRLRLGGPHRRMWPPQSASRERPRFRWPGSSRPADVAALPASRRQPCVKDRFGPAGTSSPSAIHPQRSWWQAA